MTNPETGETKEISMEEFMEIMRSGQGSLQQIVKHADGTTSSTTLYGNVNEDGLDRSVNIFVDGDSFNAFLMRKIKKITGELKDPESEKDPDDLYEMTVDFTESAIMGILKMTRDELSINLYTRDERKATFDHLRQGSKSWKVNPDSTIDFNGADLQGADKTVSLYMLAFLEMRQFLRASGKLDVLKRLGNRGTGVILKATGQADDAEATIVRGKNRPDLPCQMFLLGEQMMRPYVDELMSDMMMSGMSLEEKIEAAEDGDPDCMESLAKAYLDGVGVEQDFDKCAYWWKKLAESGNAVGMFNIGLHYAKGCGVERSFETAAEWMERAAEAGDEDAPAIAEKYRSEAELQRKAEAGNAQAMAELSGVYMSMGGSLEQAGPGSDYAESLKWAQKAVDAGCAAGYWPLALAYEHGRGVEPDTERAIEFYRKGAELGNAPCQHSYACYILRGEIPEDRPGQTMELLEKSAAQGYALAYRTLGYQYEQDGDMDKELEYFEKACLADPSDAEFVRHVAFQYENGDGSDAIDLERAIHWFKVAADHGDMLAMHEYQRLTAPPPAFEAKPEDDQPMPPYEFDLTNTKKGDRKERSNRIKVGDKVTFRLNSAGDRVDAVTSLGDVGDISTDSWLSKLLKKEIPYKAEIIHVISYNSLENKRKNPTVTVRLKIDAARGEVRKLFGWSFIPDGIYGDGSYGFWGGFTDDTDPAVSTEEPGLPDGYMEAMALFETAEEAGYEEPDNGGAVSISEPLAFLTEKAKAGDKAAREAIKAYFDGNPDEPAATPEMLALLQAWNDEEVAEDARRKAEAEAAEAKRKAEAEATEKRRAEEARRREEEQQRKAEEARREAEQKAREKSEALAAVDGEIQAENDAYKEKSESLGSTIKKATQEIEALNGKKKALGVFKFKDKKAIDTEIAAANGQITESKEALQQLDRTHNAVMDRLSRKRTLLKPEIGNVLTFGTDPNTKSSAALRWKVIEVAGDEVVLLAECVVGLQSFYMAGKWLKDKFYQTAFSNAERSVMEKIQGEFVCLPTSGQIEKEPRTAVVSEHLRDSIIRECKEDGARYRHTTGQIQNSIKYQLECTELYWIDSKVNKDGFAATSHGWIGAGASFGVRPVIKINVRKLREKS